MEAGREAVCKVGTEKEALAIAMDEALLLCRRLHHDNNIWALRSLTGKCLRELKLEKKLRRRLKKIEGVLVDKPEKAFAYFARLRAAFSVPVAPLL